SPALRLPHRPPLFPYTTLFRSPEPASLPARSFSPLCVRLTALPPSRSLTDFQISVSVNPRSHRLISQSRPRHRNPLPSKAHSSRSEEHTSELQSRENLVCRLLL